MSLVRNVCFWMKRRRSPEWPGQTLSRDAIDRAGAVLVLIGPNWLHIQDEQSGRRRIDVEDDWVRHEVLEALRLKSSRENLLLIPVLVGNTEMPRSEFLEGDLKRLADFQPERLFRAENVVDFAGIIHHLERRGYQPIYPQPVVTPDDPYRPKEPLSDKEVDDFLAEMPSWRIVESDKPGSPGHIIRELYKKFEFNSYEDAWKFMSLIDNRGIRPYNHHPRIRIHTTASKYGCVHSTFITSRPPRTSDSRE